MRRIICGLILIFASFLPAHAAPHVPLNYFWTVDAFATWNTAHGEALKRGGIGCVTLQATDGTWLVVQEILADLVLVNPSSWRVHAFQSSAQASAFYDSLGSAGRAMVTTPTGRIVIAYRLSQ